MVTLWPHPKPVKGQRQTTFADQRYNHSAAFCPSRLFSTAAGAPPPPIPCPNPGVSSETAAAHCPACSALASTLDALAYNFRDGLTLPALDMPQQLAAPAPLTPKPCFTCDTRFTHFTRSTHFTHLLLEIQLQQSALHHQALALVRLTSD